MTDSPSKKAKMKISGMSCATCALNIEKSLDNLDGVKKANVNLNTEEADVEYDPKKVKFQELENAIKKSGYGVINEKVALKIGGMTCAMCVNAIEDVLSKLDGVSEV
ncbi:MAG: heavy-metal-associated domain-containing protein, partial [Methanobacterium sp.]